MTKTTTNNAAELRNVLAALADLTARVEALTAEAEAPKAPKAPKAPEAPKAKPEAAPEAKTETAPETAPETAKPAEVINPESAEGKSAEATEKWASFVHSGGRFADLRKVYAIGGRSYVRLNKRFVSVKSAELQRVYITADKAKAEANYQTKAAEAKAARAEQQAEQAEREARAEAERIALAAERAEAERKAEAEQRAKADKAAKRAAERKAKAAPVEAEAPKAPQPVSGKPWRAKGAKQVTTYDVSADNGQTLFVPVFEAPCKQYAEPSATLRTARVRNIEFTAVRSYYRRGYKVACILHCGQWSWLYLESPAQGEEAHRAAADPRNWDYSPARAAVRRTFTD